MKTLPEMLERVVAENAGRTAVVDDEVATTYAELESAVASRALDLRRRGIRPGDAVALMLSNGVDFVTTYFAIVSLGAIAVPLNDHYRQNELLYFLDACGVSCLLTSQSFADLCRQVLSGREAACELLLVEDRPVQSGATLASLRELGVDVDPDAPAMYQFSSGSTGTPKRIARTHRNLLYELDSFKQTLGITNEDRFIGVAPFSHVNGLMRSMMASMRAGAALYPLPKFQRRAVAELIEKHRITVFIAVPFMFSMLAQSRFRRRPDFSSLRLSVSASAPMPKKLNQEFYQQFGMYVRQLYGCTETGTISVNLRPDVENSLTSVGTPIAGVEVEVFTEEGQVARVDETGEFAVKSPAAIAGYVGLDEVNKAVFRDGYFFTGDLGRKDEAGLLYLVGRKKFFINKGGYKINPYEIEELIEEHPKVKEAVVIGMPTPYGDEKVKAVVVPAAACTAEEVVEFCSGQIADFKIPSLVEFRDSLPKSPTGKVRRKMLLEQ